MCLYVSVHVCVCLCRGERIHYYVWLCKHERERTLPCVSSASLSLQPSAFLRPEPGALPA